MLHSLSLFTDSDTILTAYFPRMAASSQEERDEWNKNNEVNSLFCCADTWVAARLAAGGVLVAIDRIFLEGFGGVIICLIR